MGSRDFWKNSDIAPPLDDLRSVPRDVFGGGDSAPAPAAPTSQTVTQTNIPEWAKPYAEDVMSRAQAVSKTGYQPYYGQRIADFSGLQGQAFAGAANMQPSGALNSAADTANQAAQRAMGIGYNPMQAQNQYYAGNVPSLQTFQMGPAERVGTSSFLQPGMAGAYMSPYMQNVVEQQQRDAQRQADVASTYRGAQAVKAGGYGGYRQAIENAEAQRNLAEQKGDIMGAGLQSAFTAGQGQFNTEQQARMQAAMANQQAGLTTGTQNLQAALGVQQGNQQAAMEQAAQRAQYGQQAQQLSEQSRQYGAGLGLQGLQAAIQGAGTAGALGGQAFQQQMDINKLQQLYGTQQQQRTQDVLSQQYQDFLNQQNYPYKQIGFLSDVVRGTGQLSSGTTGASIYQAPPSTTAQLTGLGTAALGLSGLSKAMMAQGGSVNAGLADLAISRMA